MTPDQCVLLEGRFPQLKIAIQSSPVRRIGDAEYSAAGLDVREDVSDCDVLIGVKEVNIEDLVPGKTYLFFSHTHKLQPYNAKLLAAILDKKIRLIDYELLKRPSGRRIIGFGRWAGLVGAYSGLRAYGLQVDRLNCPRPSTAATSKKCSRTSRVSPFPRTSRLSSQAMAGWGKALVKCWTMKLRSVHPDDFLRMDFPEPVFTHLDVEDYNARTDRAFSMDDFVTDPLEFESTFPRYAHAANLFIAGHFWAEGSPFPFTREDMRHPDWKVNVVADISCDIDGPVACTLHVLLPSKIHFTATAGTAHKVRLTTGKALPSLRWTTYRTSCPRRVRGVRPRVDGARHSVVSGRRWRRHPRRSKRDDVGGVERALCLPRGICPKRSRLKFNCGVFLYE